MEESSAFRSEELWRPSIFTLDADPNGSIFDSLQLDAFPTLPPKPADGNLFDAISDDLGLPPLEDLSPDAQEEQTTAETLGANPDLDEASTGQADDHDVWALDDGPASPRSEPQLLTWEAFELKADRPAHPFYLTEAGDGAFDAVFQQHEHSEGVIPHDAVLRACVSLVLGRSSIFFRWDAAKGCFCPVLDKVAISGFSLFASRDLTDGFSETGLAFRELGAFVGKPNARDCTAMVALKRCVSVVLDSCERQICEQIPCTRSLLQLQGAVERPHYILSHLRTMAKAFSHFCTDEDLISALSDEVTRLAESGSIAANVMQQILAHVSMPWLQRLAEETGLAPRLCMIQDSAAVHEAADTEPGNHFISPEDNRMISNVKRSINLLREHVPDDPFTSPESTMNDGCAQLPTQIVDVESVVQRAEEYKVRMESAISQQRCKSRPSQHDAPNTTNLLIENGDIFSTSMLDNLASVVEEDISTNSPESEDVYCSLQKSLASVFDDPPENRTKGLSTKLDLLAPLRPFIEVQASLVNDAVADYLFNTYKLREHLDLHRSYHLFGNGDFVTRLTTALFSDGVQSAERKRGKIPTSETMGLRLGSREVQRWPPASSELRLTLLNVLSESYAPGSPDNTDLHLPGGLSFAIRELSDAEIDKVMDPTSIHALDFLRLQYTPPPPLAPIFTPTVLHHYDAIFRALLIHARVLHATATLRPWPRQPHHANNTATLRRFARKARHFSTTLLSHFADTAIAPAWKAFAQRLDEAQAAPRTASLASLAEAHALTLASIRAKLFLRRKQEPLRRVVEEMAELVVKAPAGGGVGMAERERRFDGLCGELGGLLEGLAVKSGERREEGVVGVGGSEGEAAGLLGRRLRWGGEGEGK